MSKQKPIKEFRAGGIQVAIWKKETEENGKTIIKYSISIQKSFRDDSGNYQDTNNYFPDELPKLALLIHKAYETITLKEWSPEDDS